MSRYQVMRDDELLVRAVNADRAAMGELLERSRAAVQRRATLRLGRRRQAALSPEDIVQETFIDADRSICSGKFIPQDVRAFTKRLETTTDNNVRDAIAAMEAIKREGGIARVALADAKLLDSLGGQTCRE